MDIKIYLNYHVYMESKKLSIFYILEILKEYSDINHPLTQQNIIDLVYEKYDLFLERKSVSYSLSLLKDLGYDINEIHKKGSYLLEREFNESEINYLIDAIFSSKSIPQKEAQHLSKKLSSFLSIYERKDFSKVNKISTMSRTKNDEVMLNIEIINEAIKKNKKITFDYLEYDLNGKLEPRKRKNKYSLSPYLLFNSMGRYYLLSKYDYFNNISFFRIEYIKNVQISEKDRKDPKTIKQLNNFDISSFLNDHLYLFDDEVIKAKLQCLGNEKEIKKSIFTLNDYFSKNVYIKKENNKIYAYVRCDKSSLKLWLIQYGLNLKVIEPQSLKDDVKELLDKMSKVYLD